MKRFRLCWRLDNLLPFASVMFLHICGSVKENPLVYTFTPENAAPAFKYVSAQGHCRGNIYSFQGCKVFRAL